MVPANAYLSDSSQGPGWHCERGFRAVSGRCEAVQLPENGYLTIAGDSWACEPPYRKRGAVCVRP